MGVERLYFFGQQLIDTSYFWQKNGHRLFFGAFNGGSNGGVRVAHKPQLSVEHPELAPSNKGGKESDYSRKLCGGGGAIVCLKSVRRNFQHLPMVPFIFVWGLILFGASGGVMFGAKLLHEEKRWHGVVLLFFGVLLSALFLYLHGWNFGT